MKGFGTLLYVKQFPTFEYEVPLWEEDFLVVGIDEVGRGALAGPLGVGAVAFDKLKVKNEKSKVAGIGINDSKKVSAKKREEISKFIFENARYSGSESFENRSWSLCSTLVDTNVRKRAPFSPPQDDKVILFASTVHVSAAEINAFGISKAFENGVKLLVDRCVNVFKNRKLFILIDGNFSFPINNIDYTSKRSNFNILQPSLIGSKSIIKGDAKSLSIAAASIIAKVARDTYMKNLAIEFPNYGFEKHVGYGTAVHSAAIKQFGKCPEHRDLFLRKILG